MLWIVIVETPSWQAADLARFLPADASDAVLSDAVPTPPGDGLAERPGQCSEVALYIFVQFINLEGQVFDVDLSC